MLVSVRTEKICTDACARVVPVRECACVCVCADAHADVCMPTVDASTRSRARLARTVPMARENIRCHAHGGEAASRRSSRPPVHIARARACVGRDSTVAIAARRDRDGARACVREKMCVRACPCVRARKNVRACVCVCARARARLYRQLSVVDHPTAARRSSRTATSECRRGAPRRDERVRCARCVRVAGARTHRARSFVVAHKRHRAHHARAHAPTNMRARANAHVSTALPGAMFTDRSARIGRSVGRARWKCVGIASVRAFLRRSVRRLLRRSVDLTIVACAHVYKYVRTTCVCVRAHPRDRA